MPNDSSQHKTPSRPQIHYRYLTASEQQDLEFPDIRIGNDPPLNLLPSPPTRPSRYPPKPASISKIGNGTTLNTSRAFNKLSSPDLGKSRKVNVRILPFLVKTDLNLSGYITMRMTKNHLRQSGSARQGGWEIR